jgi:predicted xylose isomerase-like sugar epimerase
MENSKIDREQPLDVCKIQARAQLEHRENKGMTKAKALRIVSDESGIPISTLKKWTYPKQMENDKIRKREARAKAKKTGRTSAPLKKPEVIESTVDSIVIVDSILVQTIRSLAYDTGMPINTILALGLDEYKHKYM